MTASEIMERLAGLERKELSVVLNDVLDEEAGPRTTAFIHFLKSAGPELRSQLLKKIPGPTGQWLDGRIDALK